MKNLLLIIFLSSLFLSGYTQVYVNKIDLNKEVKSFELHMAKKPFNTKDVYYIDYGQDNFKEHFYDHKNQAVFDKDNRKFEKGEYMKLHNYLESEGWVKDSQRESKLGNNEVVIIMFKRKE